MSSSPIYNNEFKKERKGQNVYHPSSQNPRQSQHQTTVWMHPAQNPKEQQPATHRQEMVGKIIKENFYSYKSELRKIEKRKDDVIRQVQKAQEELQHLQDECAKIIVKFQPTCSESRKTIQEIEKKFKQSQQQQLLLQKLPQLSLHEQKVRGQRRVQFKQYIKEESPIKSINNKCTPLEHDLGAVREISEQSQALRAEYKVKSEQLVSGFRCLKFGNLVQSKDKTEMGHQICREFLTFRGKIDKAAKSSSDQNEKGFRQKQQ